MIIIVGHQAAMEKIEILATGVGGRLLHVYGHLVGTCGRVIGKSLVANIGNDR